jgi:hypothetical protein
VNVEYAPGVTPQALPLCLKLHESKTIVVSSFTMVAMLGQLVMFIVDTLTASRSSKRMIAVRCSPASRRNQSPFGTEQRSPLVTQRAVRPSSSSPRACRETASIRSSCRSNISANVCSTTNCVSVPTKRHGHLPDSRRLSPALTNFLRTRDGSQNAADQARQWWGGGR